MKAQHSLSRRLMVGLVLASFFYWAVVAAFTIRDSVDDVYELFDAHLAQTALALLRVTDPDENDPAQIPLRAKAPAIAEIFGQWSDMKQRLAKARASGAGAPADAALVPGSIHSMHDAYEKNLRYQVWGGDGNLLLRSANAPPIVMTALDGYSETSDDAARVWRHFAVWDRHHDYRIVVSEAHDLRNRLVRNIALHVASPLVLGLPILLLLLWLSIRRGLHPLNDVTREFETREPQNLTPLDLGHAPVEVRPLVAALNQLLARMTHALEGERRFTANAAHELRTPLAAIQAQLFVARSAHGEDERGRALDQLQRGVERGIRLVGQLLTLARLDPEQDLPERVDVDLGEVAQAVCAELAPLALLRHQTLELNAPDDLPRVQGNADMLSMLLSNLVDNAIRYTPSGGRIEVVLKRDANGLVMQVGDDGPGIAPAQRERVFDRFYRIASQDQPGTGLGLAICHRVAQLHGARIVLSDGPQARGLMASVALAART